MLVALMGLTLVTCAQEGDDFVQDDLGEDTAALCCNYPTRWTLINATSVALTFTCSSTQLSGLPNITATMPNTTVQPASSTIYTWSSSWYNDGLGLNYGNWTCSAKQSNGTTYATTTMTTDWGENIRLRAKTGGILAAEHP
jgi:hypothetical protein